MISLLKRLWKSAECIKGKLVRKFVDGQKLQIINE